MTPYSTVFLITPAALANVDGVSVLSKEPNMTASLASSFGRTTLRIRPCALLGPT